MAISKLSVLVAALVCCSLVRVSQCGGGGSHNYTSMFSFGDSLTDTGNLLVSSPLSFTIVGRFPYGMTYFHRPTGRCSDGRLVVDFLAQAFGLPLLQPYLSRGKAVRQGVNFAVGGATAMDPPFFEEIGASDKLWTNLSLSVQLGWFEQLKPSLCDSPKNCKEYFSKSLFLVGEIGGNDYNFAFFKGKSLDDAKTYVPTVASAITDATERLIKAGAMHLVVPGNLPIGCSSAYLTMHPSRNKSDYDSTGCLKTYNDFAQHHNAVLQQKLQVLRQKYPQARIMYADYYGAAMSFAQNPKQFAEEFRVPFVPPFLGQGQNFIRGANFAVVGATALDLAFFLKSNITSVPPFNSSLSVQLEWFQKLKPTLCSTPAGCKEYFKRSLFFMGEFGGNDYIFILAAGKTVKQVMSYVPKVVEAISAGVEAVIQEGAKYVVVPGQLPTGCIPIILTLYASPNKTDYDAGTGCLKRFNALARHHNSALFEAVSRLRYKYPAAKIIYADYYEPVIAFLKKPARFGFSGSTRLRACCGAGGPYNYNLTAPCGFPGASACRDPAAYPNWDGIHLTEPAYKLMAAGWLEGPYAHPPILRAVRP